MRTSVGSGAAGKAATAAVDRDAKNEKAGRAAAAALGIPPKKKK